jgi:hypothetical protein
MTPKTLESEVPPLKTALAPSAGDAKIRPNNQHTQKSFSEMTGCTRLSCS